MAPKMQSERLMMRFLKWLFRRGPVPKPVIYDSFVANEISSTWLVRCLADPKKARAMIRARYWLPPNRGIRYRSSPARPVRSAAAGPATTVPVRQGSIEVY